MSLSSGAHVDVETFRAALARHMGLRFDDDKIPLLREVLAERLHVSAVGAADYVERTLPTPSEMAELARGLSVGETYFLRNQDQFRAVESLLHERARTGTRHLRILSAGCSSGEEPFSLAIVVRENLPNLAAWNVSIQAFDLNPDAIDKAGAARYTVWSLRETPDTIQQKYIGRHNTTFVVSDTVREMVQFHCRNLMDPDPDFWRPGAFDLVFCRNVLMYFTPEATREVVARIAASLVPGGYLFLGHAENLRGISRDFHLCQSHQSFYYQRRETLDSEAFEQQMHALETPRRVQALPIPSDASWVEVIARASSRIEHLAKDPRHSRAGAAAEPTGSSRPAQSGFTAPRQNLGPTMDLLRQERFQEGLIALAGDAEASDPDALLLRAVLLVSSGDAPAAERACKELIEIDDLSAGAHYVMALCREHANDRQGAIEQDQLAVYLDSDFAMPHLHLGLIWRRSGDLAVARRELEIACMLLLAEDAARIVLHGGGFGREALIIFCRTALAACGGPQ